MTLARRHRLVFFGSDEIALPALDTVRERLFDLVEIVAVFSRPDKPSGRGQKVQPNAVSAWALRHGIALRRPECPDAETVRELKSMGCDIALVMAYGHLLKAELLDSVPLGFYNLHGSLLPKFRGATPVEGAIVAGESVTGVSLQRVALRLDSGDVADCEVFPMSPEDTAESVRRRIAEVSAPLVLRVLPAILSGSARFAPQDESSVSHTRKIRREDDAVDFSASPCELAARVRALNPWPGVVFLHSGQRIKIGSAEVVSGVFPPDGMLPGTVLGRDASGLLVIAGGGVLRLRELQRPGGRMLPACAFLAGFPIAEGDVLPSAAMAPLVSRSPFKVIKAAPAS